MSRPEEALDALAAELRAGDTVISPHVPEPEPAEAPALGLLAASGPRASDAPGEYALLVESIREGYLLHYGEPRLIATADRDLELLAGDYLYALGLDRLAALRDMEAVRELADLISLVAQLHAEGRDGAAPLWLGSVAKVAVGGDPDHEDAKAALRAGRPGASQDLVRIATRQAESAGLGGRLGAAAESIGFALP